MLCAGKDELSVIRANLKVAGGDTSTFHLTPASIVYQLTKPYPGPRRSRFCKRKILHWPESYNLGKCASFENLNYGLIHREDNRSACLRLNQNSRSVGIGTALLRNQLFDLGHARHHL